MYLKHYRQWLHIPSLILPCTCTDLPKSYPQSTPSHPQTTYIVSVKTAAQTNAGTDARAYVTLHGSGGRLGRKRLVRSGGDGKGFRFTPGSLERFRVRGRGVEELSHMTLEHDGLGAGQGWLVERVLVKEDGGRGRSWECVCNQWLSLHRSDQQV